MEQAIADNEGPLAQYEVIKPIGKGKFAVVYRARRKSDNQLVAIKRISVDMMDMKTRDKCLKEVRVLQNLDHPNIIRYLESFIHGNDLFIVFEWAAAGDLKRQLRKAQEKNTQFSERIVWKYFAQICEAMQHMHERRIMHRDLKPANIFLTTDGTIKVGDLGLSREMSDETMQAYSKVGTPLYMSPEVLKGDGYDFKSDIWSIGCLLYELAMLKSPFKSEGLNLYLLFQKISRAEYQPVTEDYSSELRGLVTAMLNTKADDRPDIRYVCDIARRMRDTTAQEYMRQKRNVGNLTSDGSMASSIPTERAEVRTRSSPAQFSNDKPPRQTLAQPAQQDSSRPTSAIKLKAAEEKADARKETENDFVTSDRFQAMLAMDALYDNLTLLGYPLSLPDTVGAPSKLPPIHRLYFVFEAQMYNTPFRSQMQDVVHITCWLLEKCGAPHLANFENMENEPPVAVARQLISCVQQLTGRQDQLHSISLSALTRGNGVAVCTFLKNLSMHAMKGLSRPQILRLDKEHTPSRNDRQVVPAEDDEDDGDDDDDGDSIATESDADENSPLPLGYHVSQAESLHMLSYVAPHADGKGWYQETETVAPRFALSRKDLPALSLGGWQAHYSLFQSNTADLKRYTTSSKEYEQPWLQHGLWSFHASAAETMTHCEKTENALVANGNLKQHQFDFQQATEANTQLLKQLEASSALVSDLVQRLEEITGCIHDLEHNTTQLLEAGSDPHKLVSIKASISELQSHIKGLDISWATVSYRLTSQRLRSQQRAHKLRRTRSGRSNKAKHFSGVDDDDL